MAYMAKGRKKSFAIFDCDSHVHEPPAVWDEYIPSSQREFAKSHFYRDNDRLIFVRNGMESRGDPRTASYAGEVWHPGFCELKGSPRS